MTRRELRNMLLALGLAVVAVLSLPVVRFDEPFSTVLYDRNGELLAARTASDEQWRFPLRPMLPDRFVTAVVTYEDDRFFSHPGVDPLAIGRAFWQNLRAGEIESGASTLTMQVVRLSRHGQPRTLGQKIIEAVLAVRLELCRSKQEVLALWAAHAPFGGNVVGLEAAAWRYFGRAPAELSWAETATLAVLPNNPALVHPGRNRATLRQKRDRLLDTLHAAGALDAETLSLAKAEPLPEAPKPMPLLTPHLLDRAHADGHAGERVLTSVDAELQRHVAEIVSRHAERLLQNQVHNAAALVLSVGDGSVLAYVGNTPDSENEHGGSVDIITAPRSTGSLLKPALYASMLDAGEVLPHALVADLPVSMAGFSPENFGKTYDGAVPAARALSRSLNVPAVHMLKTHGVARTQDTLARLGMTTLTRPSTDYGLTLVLGGAEGTLWELAGLYANLARSAHGNPLPVRAPTYLANATVTPQPGPVGAGAAFATLSALLEVSRPGAGAAWKGFASSFPVAWKTGTSFGFRDAWAIGVTPTHVVAVWAGNADGEGRPDLTGQLAAAPVLFELFDLVGGGGWFAAPEEDLVEIEVCTHSGMRAGPHCRRTHGERVPRAGLGSPACRFCQEVACDAGCAHRVHAECAAPEEIEIQPWFVLPPGMAYFYSRHHPEYRPLPPWRNDCAVADASAAMSVVIPREGAALFVPIELDGERGRAVFEAAHVDKNARVFWHLDDEFVAETGDLHQVALAPAEGEHLLTLVDDRGNRLERRFRVWSSSTP